MTRNRSGWWYRWPVPVALLLVAWPVAMLAALIQVTRQHRTKTQQGGSHD